MRLRDCYGQGGANCISCYEWFPFEKLYAGHYRPTTHKSTRFNEYNVHAQCHRCNRYLHANLTGYFRGLERKIGREKLDELDAIPKDKKWTVEELKEIQQYYKDKIRELESGIPPAPLRDGLDMQSMFDGLPTPGDSLRNIFEADNS